MGLITIPPAILNMISIYSKTFLWYNHLATTFAFFYCCNFYSYNNQIKAWAANLARAVAQSAAATLHYCVTLSCIAATWKWHSKHFLCGRACATVLGGFSSSPSSPHLAAAACSSSPSSLLSPCRLLLIIITTFAIIWPIMFPLHCCSEHVGLCLGGWEGAEVCVNFNVDASDQHGEERMCRKGWKQKQKKESKPASHLGGETGWGLDVYQDFCAVCRQRDGLMSSRPVCRLPFAPPTDTWREQQQPCQLRDRFSEDKRQ